MARKRREVRQSREKSNKRDPDENRSNAFEVKVQFNTIKGFEDFSNAISELLQKDPLPECLLQEYYDLCRAQKAFLHAHLFKGFKNPELIDIKSTISETVSIGIAIRTSTPFTFLDKFALWSKMLTYYEDLGMNVSLLNSRLHHLLNLTVRTDAAVYRSRYIEACRERTHCECETKKLEMILAKLKKVHVLLASEVKVLESKAGWEKYTEAYFRSNQAKDEIQEIEALIADFVKFFEHYDTVIETLKLKANKHEPRFQEEAGAPW